MHWKDLSGNTKSISKVNANNSSSLHVNHEIGQMTITNAQYVMTDAELGVGHGKLSSQSVVRLTAGTQTPIYTTTVTNEHQQ